MKEKETTKDYPFASGGWGSLRAVTTILAQEHVSVKDSAALAKQNKPDGFMCVSCSWAKPADPHVFEFCESGAKATAWDLTSKRMTPEFFQLHTVTELLSWHDHDLEEAGRLTAPLRYDPATDKYVQIEWQQAFDEIGRELNQLEPDSVVFYASGRASLETSYMYQLFARMYGTNNLPDSSNMCHESTSVGLKEAIGVGVGTITLEDFEKTDLMFFFGQNVGTNSPRMLHQLQDARKRGVPIITFNPLREPGLVRFANPQSPVQMLTPDNTQISTQYHQLKTGGDTAAILGICKAVIAADDLALEQARPRVIDVDFVREHTTGYEAFANYAREVSWADIESVSGLPRDAMEAAAAEYIKANAVMIHYGMGLTQHRLGVQNVRMVCNLLLLRGNIGKPGAGPSPVRGHSNVQGQRTVGITEKPELAPLDKLASQFSFEPPRKKGLNTVEAFEAMLKGEVKGVFNLGGNLVRSVPDRLRIEPAWRGLRLNVNVATKLNRSHLVHGEVSYILPCLSRIEIDRQASGEQAVSMEDSTSCMHGSRGVAEPASENIRSEPYIVAGIAKATLGSRFNVDWDGWRDDYSIVRNEIAKTYPEIFHDFNQRMWQPGGFPKPLPARERQWKTKSGKAEFMVPKALGEDPDMPERGADALRLMTLRSDSQFNTTIYGLDDRFRGVKGSRMIVLMNKDDMAANGLSEGDRISLQTIADDDFDRRVSGLTVKEYDIPAGCIGGYYPECNPLLPLWHYAEESKVPGAKSIPVRIVDKPGASASA
ncbi:FdhF/YdeP family oxidoreductase [bacterium M00.F.Ca.ET.228.01.1.1]|uniref:FdhF/YdeP family oxidoreductase n=1 Tax=Paraburkholderia phenoliruptrix TaxID=252970 RepID=UPI001091DC1D|nr:FdhF/YdeP family oxidoreductase [Paraburkholderia phenoliruptrix]TGP45962.1 FdhF/YdeP family oxidoreductase [bacterium M00.F.Ca.ET.228.01.1.1]TGS04125.1 FdhF/YdeP family oxidoreductase [bacterium M00.F.Ca.ET.191.01.1.1]TGU07255.1 FdhF/YdeP family oxidoreductase [bacterium M00.F.Ca.ET.155.01.1.1]MBW0446491.1 FdhF/YdeP family oxidoreductase [Paraburkholderia phenoliruptrix]MBW9097082.1 FdhF/YdeP family oxidoreductase [Paraburkholderia phenoliruptrix]